MPEFLLELKKITKAFGNVHALNFVDFDLRHGEVHALLGANGAGKSTLVKMISGAYEPDSGEIVLEGSPITISSTQMSKDLGISIVYQEFSLFNDLSIAENIFAGRVPLLSKFPPIIDENKMKEDAEKALRNVGISLDVKKLVGELPVGEQQIIEICKAISLQAKVLILDEPTSALNAQEIEQLFKIIKNLKEQKVGIIYITHRLSELTEICDRVTIMRDGKNIGTHSIKEKSMGEMVDLMLGESGQAAQKVKKNIQSDKKVLEILNLKTKDLNNISLYVRPGEILGLAGQMGSGRTEIFKSIFGYEKIESGVIKIESTEFKNPVRKKMIRKGIGFVSEDRKTEGILPGRSIKENIVVSIMNQITTNGFISNKKEEEVSQTAIAQTGLYPNIPNRNIEFLSGGNQQKAILGRWLALDNLKVLLLDEPTRGIDVGAKGQIYTLLNEITQKGIAIIIASSDLDELVQVTDRIVILDNGKIQQEIKNENISVNDLTKAILGGE
ncbi:sugar ABC transporter ATP-binding protein [Sporosarcina sp. 179-K 3D1 HS]|uniref:sugar ABC transporter ATP-binding protein n=1 Tax=Sporosarcina sp. 179-K 3D1 HS TaxID=3232169 RepID=UPI0039A3E58D